MADESGPTVLENWAATLTNKRLASDLRDLSTNIRFHKSADRAALLREAAKRLEAS